MRNSSSFFYSPWIEFSKQWRNSSRPGLERADFKYTKKKNKLLNSWKAWSGRKGKALQLDVKSIWVFDWFTFLWKIPCENNLFQIADTMWLISFVFGNALSSFRLFFLYEHNLFTYYSSLEWRNKTKKKIIVCERTDNQPHLEVSAVTLSKDDKRKSSLRQNVE